MTSQPTTDSPEVTALIDRAAVLQRSGAFAAAQSLLLQALALSPQSLAATLGLGQILLDLKQADKAMPLFQSCISSQPNNAQARFGLGMALLAHGQFNNAAPAFLKASRLAPAWIPPRLMLAKCLTDLGRQSEALNVLRQTTHDLPEDADAWMQLGHVQRTLNDNAGAEQSYRRCLALSPDDPNALNNLGVALRAQDRFEDAIAVYRKALQLAPTNALLHANLGNALDLMGFATQAEQHLREAVALSPHAVDAQYNLAVHLIREEKPDDAIPALRHIITAHPQRWDAWTNLGVGLVAIGEMSEAESCYRRALRLRPTAPEAHYNLAWLLLLTGRWAEGWAEYAWRWSLPNFSSLKRTHTTPAWDGTSQPRGTILLHAEQGLGDTIQFVRYAKQVRSMCGRVILECPPSLIPLLKDVEGIDDIVALGQALPPHDFYVPLLSVPGLLGAMPENVPSAEGYLSPPAMHPPNLKLPDTKRPKVGFVWAGSPDNKIDKRRSCDVGHFVRVLENAQIDLVSLQTGPRADDLKGADLPNLTFDISDQVKDWAETAAVISQLDLIIGVDTAVAHVAGALGKPCWILLPASPDFRWLLNRADTPWYTSVRLFRQRVRGDWAGLFEDVKAALTLWLHPSA